MIKRTIEISAEPMHLAVRDRQLLLLRKDLTPRPLPSSPSNLAASIPTEDLALVVVDEGATTYSHAALAELIDRGCVVIICGRDHLPSGLLLPMAEHTEVVWRLRDQIRASKPLRKRLWQSLVRGKIRAQARALPEEASAARSRLLALARDVKSGDHENHEAQAAVIYWSAWLGDSAPDPPFRREPGNPAAKCPNNFLDYGYAVLRAAVARALVSAGLLPALGLKHKNRSNVFCLADDMIEPLRPVVDRAAAELFTRGERSLTQPNKARLLLTLTASLKDASGTGPLLTVLHRYVASLTGSLATGADSLDIPTLVEPPPPARRKPDLPWNPMVVVQRIGRLDRIGQRSPQILVVNLACTGTIEARILHRLYERIGIFEHSIGELEPILGDMVRELEEELFRPRLTDEEQVKILHSREIAIETQRRKQRALEQQAELLIGHDEFFRAKLDRIRRFGRYVGGDELRLFADNELRSLAPGLVFEEDQAPGVYRLAYRSEVERIVDKLPEPDPDPDDALPEPELWAVAGMSLWTHTPSASSVLVPGMWIATVRVGASMRTTDSTSSSFMCSSMRKSPGWMNLADAKPHSSPRPIMNGCSGVAFRRRLVTMKPWCSPRRMLAASRTRE